MPPLSRVALLAVALSLLAPLGALGSTADSAEGRSEAVASDPPIVVVWGEYERAHSSATGDLYVVQPDAPHARVVRRWGSYGRDGKPYGAFDASWSPDRSSIGLSLAVFFSDPGSQAAVIDPAGRSLRSLTGSCDSPLRDLDAGWDRSDPRSLLEGWTLPDSAGFRWAIEAVACRSGPRNCRPE